MNIKKAKEKCEKGLKKLLHSLPKSAQNMKVVKNAADIMEGVQEEVKELSKDASKEFASFMKKWGTSLKDIESLVSNAGSEASKQAQKGMDDLSKKYKSGELSQKIGAELDKVLNSIGLQRKKPALKIKLPVKVTPKRSAKASDAKKAIPEKAAAKKPASKPQAGSAKLKAPSKATSKSSKAEKTSSKPATDALPRPQ